MCCKFQFAPREINGVEMHMPAYKHVSDCSERGSSSEIDTVHASKWIICKYDSSGKKIRPRVGKMKENDRNSYRRGLIKYSPVLPFPHRVREIESGKYFPFPGDRQDRFRELRDEGLRMGLLSERNCRRSARMEKVTIYSFVAFEYPQVMNLQRVSCNKRDGRFPQKYPLVYLRNKRHKIHCRFFLVTPYP